MTKRFVEEMMEQVPVQVAVGFKQVSDEEEGRLTSVTVKDSKNLSVINRNSGEKEHMFTYDAVFNQDTDQERVYEGLVKPLLPKAKLGYNVALVVSGTYASGKSRLLRGDEKQDGIVRKLMKDLMEEMESDEDHQKRLITVSQIQFHIDGSTLDLLNPHDREIQCLKHPVLGIITEELSEIVVSSCEDAWSLYQQGTKAQKLSGTHLERCSTLFTITLEQQETDGSCIHSSIQIFDLTGGDEKDAVNGATPLVYVFDAEPSHGCIGTLLNQALGGNSYSVLIYCLRLAESWPGQAVSALKLAQGMMELKNHVTLCCWNYWELTQCLRSNIREIRMRLSSTGDLCSEDVKRLGSLVQELKMVKKQCWEKKKERSQRCEEERRRHLAAKGLLETVSDAVPSQSEQQPSLTQHDLAEYSWKMQQVRQIKQQLKEQVAEYLKAGSRSTDEIKTLLSCIQGLRERLQLEEESLQHIRLKVEQRDSMVKQRHESTALLHSDLDHLYATAMKRRTRLAEDNAALVQRELMRMERELQLQKAGRSEATVAPDETVRLKREREVVVLQLVALRREKEEAEKDLKTMHQNYKAELGNQKLQALQVLREFREASQLQLNALEKRYRKLLQDAIQDAVYLAAQKQQLELGKKHLKEVIAELRDQLSVNQQEEIPHQREGETERQTSSWISQAGQID
ncbi:chromosome-associated kinesin KIF4 isoform X2 [Heterodontus francisci]|uniref:chromosome-associated kinesin KIF4 isoform X2 n=1 Tax=Heterodontus francisci TaxID=7792 RepID=UPI00355BFD7B